MSIGLLDTYIGLLAGIFIHASMFITVVLSCQGVFFIKKVVFMYFDRI